MPVSSKDLEAYLKLRKQGEPVSVRGFQRLMGYKSPGKAERVLRRLERLGLAEKIPSGYVARKELPLELSSYLVVKGLVLPRVLVHATYATVTAVTYTFIGKPHWYMVVLLIALITPYWLEVVEQLRTARKLRKS